MNLGMVQTVVEVSKGLTFLEQVAVGVLAGVILAIIGYGVKYVRTHRNRKK
jgi:hypothetical protein